MAFDFGPTSSTTFTSANDGSDTSNYVEIPWTYGRGRYEAGSPDQVLALVAYGDASAGAAATIQIVLQDTNSGTVLWYENATLTPASTRRTAVANTSGSYFGAIAFTTTGRNTVDMVMANTIKSANQNGNLVFKIGVTDLGAYTTITLAGVSSPLT